MGVIICGMVSTLVISANLDSIKTCVQVKREGKHLLHGGLHLGKRSSLLSMVEESHRFCGVIEIGPETNVFHTPVAFGWR